MESRKGRSHVLQNFKPTEVIKEWLANGCQPTLVLVGGGGTGKTQFGHAVAAELGVKLLVINSVQGLKKLQDFHEMIMLDDFSRKKKAERNLFVSTERGFS